MPSPTTISHRFDVFMTISVLYHKLRKTGIEIQNYNNNNNNNNELLFL